MDVLIDQPAITYLFVLAAVVGLLVEIAPGPTFGIPGSVAVACGVLALWGIANQDLEWWPLPLIGLGVVLWGVLLWTPSRPGLAITAMAAFGVGSLAFTVATRDAVAILLGVVATVGAPIAFTQLQRATGRLRGLPPQTGSEALIGRQAKVAAWNGDEGKIELDGAFWTAQGPGELDVGTTVTITGYEGLRVQVERS
jgi:membrane-bound serine protease (ClpP class)